MAARAFTLPMLAVTCGPTLRSSPCLSCFALVDLKTLDGILGVKGMSDESSDMTLMLRRLLRRVGMCSPSVARLRSNRLPTRGSRTMGPVEGADVGVVGNSWRRDMPWNRRLLVSLPMRCFGLCGRLLARRRREVRSSRPTCERLVAMNVGLPKRSCPPIRLRHASGTDRRVTGALPGRRSRHRDPLRQAPRRRSAGGARRSADPRGGTISIAAIGSPALRLQAMPPASTSRTTPACPA